MDIRREETVQKAYEKVKYCLDKLEEANQFNESIIKAEANKKSMDVKEIKNRYKEYAGWNIEIVDDLTLHEMIGALIAAEQLIENEKEDFMER